MLTVDEKSKIIKEKIDNLAQSFFDAKNRLEEIESIASDREKDEILGFMLKQKGAIEYFNRVLNSLKANVDQV